MLSSKLYSEARKQRKIGKSYKAISKLFHIPKSTLSFWFSKKRWSKDIKKELIERQKNKNKKSLKLARAVRMENIKQAYSAFRKEAKNEFQILKGDPLFVAGLALYWGEGEKASHNRVSLVNTDPKLLQMVAYFYRKYLKILNDNLRIGLFLYRDIKKVNAIKFWSRTLKVPKSQFIKTQFLKSRSKLTKRKSKFGVCSLYFSNTKLSIKIHEWIRLLSLEVRE